MLPGFPLPRFCKRDLYVKSRVHRVVVFFRGKFLLSFGFEHVHAFRISVGLQSRLDGVDSKIFLRRRNLVGLRMILVIA